MAVVDNSPIAAQQLGVDVTTGAVVIDVADGSPADNAGLAPGDVIVTFNGEETEATADLTTKIQQAEPGEKVDLQVVNAEGSRSVEITLGERSLSQ